jgi:hypothetical protein
MIIAPLVNVTCTVVLSVALALYVLCIYIRLRDISLEEYTSLLAVVRVNQHNSCKYKAKLKRFQAISRTELALVWQASRCGYGRQDYYVSAENKTIVSRYLFGVVIIGLWSPPLVRVSNALMLMRLKDTRAWKVLLRTVIDTQTATMVGVNIC